jgi:hypothetical protein
MMGAKKSQTQDKIEYVKPKIEELGPVTALFGADCTGGDSPVPDDCLDGYWANSTQCDKGTVAAY